MKKNYTLFLFSLLVFPKMFAQIPDWEWMKTPVAADNSYANDVTTDTSGNVITGGEFSGGGITIEPAFYSLISNSLEPQMFLAKHSSNGEFDWAVTAESVYSSVSSVSSDNDGYIYVAGTFQESLTFINNNLNDVTITGNPLVATTFFAKFDPYGFLIWAHATEADSSVIRDIKVVGDNFYMTGFYFDNNGFSFNNIAVSPAAYGDMFIAKFTLEGTAVWAKNLNAGTLAQGYSVDADALGNVFVGGGIYESATVNGQLYEGYGDLDGFIAKYNTDGTLQWIKTSGSQSTDVTTNVKADGSGNVYISTVAYASPYNINNQAIELYGVQNHIFAKLDANGTYIWTKLAGGNNQDTFSSLELDSQGGIYAAGYSYSTYFYEINQEEAFDIFDNRHFIILHLDSEGNVEWMKTNSVSGGSALYGMSVNGEDEMYVCGMYANNINLDGFTAFAQGYHPVIAKLQLETLDTNTYTVQNKPMLYPNPATDYITIQAKNFDNAPFVMYDITGRKIISGTLNGTTTNVSALPAGVYTLKVGNNSFRLIKK